MAADYVRRALRLPPYVDKRVVEYAERHGVSINDALIRAIELSLVEGTEHDAAVRHVVTWLRECGKPELAAALELVGVP